ncbi:MAG: cyclase family protein [Bacteroidales bacterium]|nr:cyclase family protein [Bacteroidales bacterium]
MKATDLLFLSHPYTSETPSYGNRDMVKVTANSSISSGETANSSCWVFTNNHIGTHIDVPFHFSNTGKKVIDIPARDWFFEKVALIDLPFNKAGLINDTDISKFDLDFEMEMLLIRTGYENYRSADKYWNDNPGLSPEIAEYLREHFPKLRCIGFDFISITSWKYRKAGRESHKAFLAPVGNKNPIMAIEDMSLKNVTKNIQWLIVAPIIVEDGNGAPVTVIANQE